MGWKSTFEQLVKTPALWVAVVGLYHAILAWVAPTFPQAVLIAIDTFVFVVASAITGVVIRTANALKAR